MKIYLKEISDQETELGFTQDDSWVLSTVCRIDEHYEGSSQPTQSTPGTLTLPKRPVRAHFSLRRVDDVYIVSGKVETYVELICSRCAIPFKFSCTPGFSALFCKDPVLAGIAHLQKQGVDPKDIGKPTGQNQGHARHAHQEEEESDILSESKDLDITYLSHEFIDLSDVLAEQLQLQVPFQPLCQENCKGICSYCGTDLNKGHCACAKTKAQTPFSVLKDYKI